jgi:flagellar motor switch protein FliG
MTENNRQGRVTGVEKLAILMNVLGREKSMEIMREMKDPDVRRLLKVMSSMKKAPISLINNVLKEYLYRLAETEEIIFDDNLTDSELISKALGDHRAKLIFGSFKTVNLVERKNLTVLDHVDPKTLAEFLVEEHPQTIALIVAHMDADKQIAMIKHFPDSMRPEIILRMASLDYVSPEKVEELDEVLKEELKSKMGKGRANLGGVPAVAELINSLDKKTMNSLMTRLEDKDPILTEEIRQYIFSFTDIAKIDIRGIQLILREVPNDKLILALKSAPEELKEKIFGAMSERAAAMLRDDLAALGPQRLSDVERAQKEIISIVERLEEEGKIIIGVGEESELVA